MMMVLHRKWWFGFTLWCWFRCWQNCACLVSFSIFAWMSLNLKKL